MRLIMWLILDATTHVIAAAVVQVVVPWLLPVHISELVVVVVILFIFNVVEILTMLVLAALSNFRLGFTIFYWGALLFRLALPACTQRSGHLKGVHVFLFFPANCDDLPGIRFRLSLDDIFRRVTDFIVSRRGIGGTLSPTVRTSDSSLSAESDQKVVQDAPQITVHLLATVVHVDELLHHLLHLPSVARHDQDVFHEIGGVVADDAGRPEGRQEGRGEGGTLALVQGRQAEGRSGGERVDGVGHGDRAARK
mmetsp:Transcript_26799/g.53470  ORF Transcript_26799/g.53470 Transcript_26799/m.53470 type:complete len:252 (-) Transcript_26799:140-895(-)